MLLMAPAELGGWKANSHRHSELWAVKVKKLGMFRPTHCFLDLFCSHKRERIKNSFLFFSFARIISRFSHVQHFVTPCTVARQAPLSMGFSRQEYWSGLSCPSPGDLPHSGTEPMSPALAGGFSTGWATRETLPATNSMKLFIDRKMKSEWCTSALECYPALNHNGIMPVTTVWMDRVDTILRKGRRTEKDKYQKVPLTGIFLKLMQM